MYERSKMEVSGRSHKHYHRNALKTIGPAMEGLTKEEKMAEKMSDKEKRGSFVRFE